MTLAWSLFRVSAADGDPFVVIHRKAVAFHGEGIGVFVIPAFALYRHLAAVQAVGVLLPHKLVFHGAAAFAVKGPGDDAVQPQIAGPGADYGVLAAATGGQTKDHSEDERL